MLKLIRRLFVAFMMAFTMLGATAQAAGTDATLQQVYYEYHANQAAIGLQALFVGYHKGSPCTRLSRTTATCYPYTLFTKFPGRPRPCTTDACHSRPQPSNKPELWTAGRSMYFRSTRSPGRVLIAWGNLNVHRIR